MSENFFKNKNKVTQKKSNGFTLIELVTVIAIMGAMTSIVLFNFRSFSIKLEFDNLSQDIALRIVQAQKAAMTGVQNVAFTGLGHDIKPAYGVYFSAAPASTSTIGNTKFT